MCYIGQSFGRVTGLLGSGSSKRHIGNILPLKGLFNINSVIKSFIIFVYYDEPNHTTKHTILISSSTSLSEPTSRPHPP